MFFICLRIFLARVVDVTLGTLRTILIVKGKKNEAGIIAFFEVFIWFLVAKEALDNVDESLFIAIFYSLGFAVGTYIGIKITNKYIDSYLSAQVIVKKDNTLLIKNLRNKGYAVSIASLKNEKDNIKKDLLLVSINRKNAKELSSIVKKYDSSAFIIFNETKYVQNGLIK